VPDDDFDQALTEFELTRNGWTWRWPIPSSLEAIGALHTSGMPLGVVSNASGQVEQLLRRSGVCQRGDGPLVPMRVIVDSHVVGVAKPDPRIFDFALEHFEGIDRANIGYVGDSVTMDIGGATAAGLYPILIDPYDDYAGASFARIRSLGELVR
jgi:putative hydrolase of the HAD superfamily